MRRADERLHTNDRGQDTDQVVRTGEHRTFEVYVQVGRVVVRRDAVGDVLVRRSTVRQQERLRGVRVHTGGQSTAAAELVSQEHVQDHVAVLGVVRRQTALVPRAQSVLSERQRLPENSPNFTRFSLNKLFYFFLFSL